MQLLREGFLLLDFNVLLLVLWLLVSEAASHLAHNILKESQSQQGHSLALGSPKFLKDSLCLWELLRDRLLLNSSKCTSHVLAAQVAEARSHTGGMIEAGDRIKGLVFFQLTWIIERGSSKGLHGSLQGIKHKQNTRGRCLRVSLLPHQEEISLKYELGAGHLGTLWGDQHSESTWGVLSHTEEWLLPETVTPPPGFL